ncbi:hypothetical protein PG985_014760 [Apiospora marii]|uniref:TLC domain-containing protein n=1 Tax=Apiospora marii TaxID=335849 RepID=A0ABR1R425_9PEZI
MELVLGEDNLYDVRIPISELGQEGLPTAWDLGIDLKAVWAAQNASILAQNASEGWIDPSSPKIARMPREGVAPGLLPFAPLLLAVFCVAYMYFDKLLHSVLLPRFYGSLFSTQDRAQRLTFALHHNALVAFGLVLGFLGVPLLRVLAGEAVLSDPLLVAGGRVTFGDWIFVPAIAYCSTYLGEMFVRRDQPGLIPKLHHMAVLLVALTTLGITGDVERNRSATVSFYIIAVWCLFDLVTELPVHAGLIVWRCARDRARARSLARLMLGLALWRLAMLLANLGVTVYLLLAAWRKLSTIWTVLAPMAGWLWFYAQLQSAHVLYALSRRLRDEHRAAERRAKHGEGYSLEEIEDGGHSRSGLLFNDPAYAGLTLGATLLSWTHASGASQGLLSEPSRKHLLVLVGVGLAIGATVVLVRYLTQDADGALGLAARSGTAGGDKSDASNFNTHNDAKGADRTKSPHEDKNGGNHNSGGDGGGDGHGGVVERSTGLLAAVANVLRQALDENTTAATAADAVVDSVVPAVGGGSGDDGSSISPAQSENEEGSAAIRRRCADNDEWCKKAIEHHK